MKIIFSILFLAANVLFAQHIEGGFLKSCDNLKNPEAKIACTDSTLLEDVKIRWSEFRSKIEPGNYHVTYSIYSNGDKEANQIILVPQRVVLNNKPELLLELVDNSVKKHEWVLPKYDSSGATNMKNITYKFGISRYLTVNTNQL